MAEIFFFTVFLLILYPYFIYPVSIFILAKVRRPTSLLNRDMHFKLSIIIPIYNSSDLILQKVESIQSIDYPLDDIEIIFVSDGSTDDSIEILREINLPYVRFFELPQRSGKVSALNYGVLKAKYDILVFFDIRQTYDKKILNELTSSLNDDSVSGVTGDIVFKSTKGIDLYWKIETFIRQYEGLWKSTINVSGANYCIRKEDFHEFPEKIILDDLYQPLAIASNGKRILYNPNAIAFDDDYQSTLEVEKEKKTRTLSGNFQMLFEYKKFLNPFVNKAWIQYFSHKVIRLFVPLLMVLFFIVSIILSNDSNFYLIILIIQLLIYSLYIFNEALPSWITSIIVIKIAFLFIRLNKYIILGFLRYIKNSKSYLWDN